MMIHTTLWIRPWYLTWELDIRWTVVGETMITIRIRTSCAKSSRVTTMVSPTFPIARKLAMYGRRVSVSWIWLGTCVKVGACWRRPKVRGTCLRFTRIMAGDGIMSIASSKWFGTIRILKPTTIIWKATIVPWWRRCAVTYLTRIPISKCRVGPLRTDPPAVRFHLPSTWRSRPVYCRPLRLHYSFVVKDQSPVTNEMIGGIRTRIFGAFNSPSLPTRIDWIDLDDRAEC